jgi:hypothetical protein
MWVAIAGGGTVGCQSDASAICEKLYGCHLLHDVPPSADNKDGFTKDICESQVESELSESQRKDCAECMDKHPCETLVNDCRADCGPRYTPSDPSAQ